LSGGGDSSCLLCNGEVTDVLASVFDTRFGAPGEYAIVSCNACGQLQTRPRLSESDLVAAYERYYNYGSGATAYAAFRQRLVESWPYRLWLALDGDITFQTRQGQGRLLDIGCNEGRGLVAFRRNGFDAQGQEVNPVAADMARALGFEVSVGPLEKVPGESVYDVAVMSNVLEHAGDPRAMLTEAHRLLRTGGEAWISLPNAASAWRRIFGRRWINWHVPYHITHFDRVSLACLLEEQGFDLVEVRNETPALWVAQSLIAAIFARPGRPCRQMRTLVLVVPLVAMVRLLLFPLLWWLNRRGGGDALVVRASKRRVSP